ncbi:MAG: 6,7-dimethyl-8-ribityllumazine synthase [Bdellovibrionaceae bacterium]|nr:6,7-dimethyl-8-ribityllumazine synthase [Pseudobdellovibrionaceae bacterium]MDW8190929.1 6,7-dimethyl-8-ribityllumazine synthase [Pseudobdellovibrionaceae bacterium]
MFKVGLVTSLFNKEITLRLKSAAHKYLTSMGCQILEVDVPGAIEIPVACAWLIQKKCDGIVTCGAVIRGETTHYDFVWQSVERGITTLMITHMIPITVGILTTENEEQALERAGGTHGNKGEEAAQACMHMMQLKKQLLLIQ